MVEPKQEIVFRQSLRTRLVKSTMLIFMILLFYSTLQFIGREKMSLVLLILTSTVLFFSFTMTGLIRNSITVSNEMIIITNKFSQTSISFNDIKQLNISYFRAIIGGDIRVEITLELVNGDTKYINLEGYSISTITKLIHLCEKTLTSDKIDISNYKTTVVKSNNSQKYIDSKIGL